MREAEIILNKQTEFLRYLKSRFVMIHKSNFFFRDLHYGTMSFLHEHSLKSTYLIAEQASKEIAIAFESNGIFKRIDHQAWMLNYPEFALTKVEKKTTS